MGKEEACCFVTPHTPSMDLLLLERYTGEGNVAMETVSISSGSQKAVRVYVCVSLCVYVPIVLRLSC